MVYSYNIGNGGCGLFSVLHCSPFSCVLLPGNIRILNMLDEKEYTVDEALNILELEDDAFKAVLLPEGHDVPSTSKGFFIHAPKRGTKSKGSTPDPLDNFCNEIWYHGYKKVWIKIEKKLNSINDDVMQVLLTDLIKFVDNDDEELLIPTALLLTGVNLPDHCSFFSNLKSKLSNSVTSHIAMVSSCDCSTIKQMVEIIVSQLTKTTVDIEQDNLMELDDDSDPEEINVKKTDCTMPFLAKWYAETYLKKSPRKNVNTKVKKLVIVFKDFEGFESKLLHRFILILSGYIDRLPIVLVFGVSTTEAAIGENLTHQITSRLMLKVFQSPPSVHFLNNTVDKIFLTGKCPFQLSGRLFKFFTENFLFYDFSVNRFIQGIKYCVMNHFYRRDIVSLLCRKLKKNETTVLNLNKKMLEQIRALPSLRKYVEMNREKAYLLSDDEKTTDELPQLMALLRKNIDKFYVGLRVLHVLVGDLPQFPLGKQLRELYCTAMCKDITKTLEYEECFKFLAFISKDQLSKKIKQIMEIIVSSADFTRDAVQFDKFDTELSELGSIPQTSSAPESPAKIVPSSIKNRSQFKQIIAELGSKGTKKVGYEEVRERVLLFTKEFLSVNVVPYQESSPLWEIITISDTEAKNRVVPRIRGPIHTALKNPHHYLQCDCCAISDENSILPTMPDICIAYKLHLEGGSIINMYDWLQSFSMIVDPDKNKKNIEEVDEQVQARFTQALAELEFLGFIKSSRSKPDHVSRLTWGNNS